MTIGTLVAIAFFFTYGRKIEEGKPTGLFIDRLIIGIEQTERSEQHKHK